MESFSRFNSVYDPVFRCQDYCMVKQSVNTQIENLFVQVSAATATTTTTTTTTIER